MFDFINLFESGGQRRKIPQVSRGFTPVYIETYKSGLFKEKIKRAWDYMKSCVLCARYCCIDRMAGETGFCQTGKEARISSHGPHYGEESPLVGSYGSGTIFFTSCNLRCIFCQNYDISILGEGSTASIQRLAKVILTVWSRGCHNINFVTPSHQMPMILEALYIAIENGLNVPIIWNCGGYESPEALEILDGIVDIYMPDFKFWDSEPAGKYLNAPDYPNIARYALKEMHRQVGDLQFDDRGIATRGLLVRHLVMPGKLAGTEDFVKWLSKEISPDTYLNVMSQYRPCYQAADFEEINRRLTSHEYMEAVVAARKQHLRLDKE